MYTLGINAVFHDSSAALVQDGRVIAAAEEERFTRRKHGKRPVPFSTWELPFHAIHYCLKEAGLRLRDIDHVAYSFDPFLLLGDAADESTLPIPLSDPTMVQTLRASRPDRSEMESNWHGATAVLPRPAVRKAPAPTALRLEPWDTPWTPLFLSSIVNAPAQLADGAPHHFRERFSGACADGPYVWHFVEHHLTHAASAFLASPFQSAAVLTLDGRGEKATTSYSVGEGARLERLAQVNMPHSLGLLYEAVTDYLGFLRSSDEYKVMALASYGKPAFVKEFRGMIHLSSGGGYTVDAYDLVERFGPARAPRSAIEQQHFDIAHSLQKVLEETVLQLSDWLKWETGADQLCLAGGVALNCVMNAHLRDRGVFKTIWVQPAAGDAGTSLGAALWIDQQERRASGDGHYTMTHAFLGPEYSDQEIETFLKGSKLPYRRLKNIAEETAELLVQDQVIGWYQGRMEFGPRALGGRSILASPVHASMQQRLNEIKDREDFRPVAPVVLEEEAANWFKGAQASPFMLFVYDVLPEKAARIPAVCHVDGTARIQTINRAQHPRYYDLLKAFQKRTGVPVLVNTSFNTRGEPVVCSPRDAVESFWTSPLDALVIGSFLIEKTRSAHAD